MPPKKIAITENDIRNLIIDKNGNFKSQGEIAKSIEERYPLKNYSLLRAGNYTDFLIAALVALPVAMIAGALQVLIWTKSEDISAFETLVSRFHRTCSDKVPMDLIKNCIYMFGNINLQDHSWLIRKLKELYFNNARSIDKSNPSSREHAMASIRAEEEIVRNKLTLSGKTDQEAWTYDRDILLEILAFVGIAFICWRIVGTLKDASKTYFENSSQYKNRSELQALVDEYIETAKGNDDADKVQNQEVKPLLDAIGQTNAIGTLRCGLFGGANSRTTHVVEIHDAANSPHYEAQTDATTLSIQPRLG